jgi:hypothetical protein
MILPYLQILQVQRHLDWEILARSLRSCVKVEQGIRSILSSW